MNVCRDMTKPKYRAGQLWGYKNRPQEPDSALAIVKVEPSPTLGNIIHVSLTGLRVKNPRSVSGYSDYIAHMPFSEDAIDKSVVMKRVMKRGRKSMKLVGPASLPIAWLRASKLWKKY
jgi:hypothetical protein